MGELFKPQPEEEKKEKKTPNLSGDVQVVSVLEGGVKQYTKVGHLALWTNEKKTGNQPDMRGTISPPRGQTGAEYAVSVWKPKEAAK